MPKRQVMNAAYRNYVSLEAANEQAQRDPAGWVAECEAIYQEEMADTAACVAEDGGHVVLLSGPSASGKTTTALRLRDALAALGIAARTVEMDNYFLSVDRNDQELDLEAPERLDLPLLTAHIAALQRGEEILVPQFDFATGARTDKVRPLRLQKGEVAIFEGIHALNERLYPPSEHPPLAIYISARMRIISRQKVVFEPEWTRFVRRCVRDARFRGTSFERTLRLWPNVRRGEQLYIAPFKSRARVVIDTSFDYELNLLAPFALEELRGLHKTALWDAGMGSLPETLARFIPLPEALVPEDSLLREFIGKSPAAVTAAAP